MRRIVYLLATAGGVWGGLERHTIDLLTELSRDKTLDLHLIADRGYAKYIPAGVSLHAVDMAQSRRSPFLWWLIRRLIKNLQPTVVHAQGAKAAALLSAQKCMLRASGCTVVGTVHGTKSNHRAYAAMDGVVAVSAGVASTIQHPNITIICNGVRPQVPNTAALAVCQAERKQGALCVAIGRLAPVKGYDVLLQAWPKQSGAQLLILGDGPERENLERQIVQLGLQDQVTLGGHSDHVTEWLHIADAMIISSHREGFPYVLVEALQAGCPVLSTAVNGVSEIIPAEFLAAPGDSEALHKLLVAELVGIDTLASRQAPLFAKARSELTLEAMAKNTVSFYDKLKGQAYGK